jgi:hypothetical protein
MNMRPFGEIEVIADDYPDNDEPVVVVKVEAIGIFDCDAEIVFDLLQEALQKYASTCEAESGDRYRVKKSK